MQRVWNVIQRTLITGASVSVMAWALNEVSQKPDEAVQKPSMNSSTVLPVSQKSDEQTAVDVPIPAGRFTGITQTVDVVGGKIVSARVTFDK